MRFQVSTPASNQILVFWAMTSYSLVGTVPPTLQIGAVYLYQTLMATYQNTCYLDPKYNNVCSIVFPMLWHPPIILSSKYTKLPINLLKRKPSWKHNLSRAKTCATLELTVWSVCVYAQREDNKGLPATPIIFYDYIQSVCPSVFRTWISANKMNLFTWQMMMTGWVQGGGGGGEGRE